MVIIINYKNAIFLLKHKPYAKNSEVLVFSYIILTTALWKTYYYLHCYKRRSRRLETLSGLPKSVSLIKEQSQDLQPGLSNSNAYAIAPNLILSHKNVF